MTGPSEAKCSQKERLYCAEVSPRLLPSRQLWRDREWNCRSLKSTGCRRADTNGSAADLPAQQAGLLLPCEAQRLPADLQAFVVISHPTSRLKG